MNKNIFIWLAIFLICLEAVLALGVRPAKTTVDFLPLTEKESSFWIVNNDQAEMEARIFAKGDLADYIEFSQETVKLDRNEKEKQVTFKIKFPGKLPPGDLKTSIVIEQKVELRNNPYQFSARLVLEHKLVVRSAYPEKYLVGNLKFEENDQTIGFISEVTNYGSKDVQSLKTTVSVNDPASPGIEVETLEAGEETLASNETKNIKVELDKKKVSYGEFDILAKIFYDGYRLELEKKLVQGMPKIEILYFDRYFLAGKVNKVTIDLLNRWNQKLENVFVEIFIFKEGEKVDTVRTSNFDLNGKEAKKVEGYLDATKKSLGDYDFEVRVNYGGNLTSKKAAGSILNEEDYKNQAKAENRPAFWLYLAIITVLAAIVGSVVYLFRQKSRDKEEF